MGPKVENLGVYRNLCPCFLPSRPLNLCPSSDCLRSLTSVSVLAMFSSLRQTLQPLSRASRFAAAPLRTAQNASARLESTTATSQAPAAGGSTNAFADIIDALNSESATVSSGKASRDQHIIDLATGRDNNFLTPYYYSHKYGTRPPRSINRKTLGPDAPDSRYLDPFRQLALDPLAECQNAALLSEFVTPMGKLIGRKETGLTWRSQRRLSKAIRRAKMMGVMPALYQQELEYRDPTDFDYGRSSQPRRTNFQRLTPKGR